MAAFVRRLPAALGLVGLAGVAGGWISYRQVGLIEVDHTPRKFMRRAGDLTANVTGRLGRFVSDAEWRVNGGAWHRIRQAFPRSEAPWFTAEIDPGLLRPRANRLELRARAPLHPESRIERIVDYDVLPPRFPLEVDWKTADLDVQDGAWERVEVGHESRIRPRPDAIGYDRIVLVSGAFGGGRRIRTSVTLRRAQRDRLWGFGVLPLWGGHPDRVASQSPRRGWRYAIAWYYSRPGGVGVEFSERFGGDQKHATHSTYREVEVAAGTRWYVLVECRPVIDLRGRHLAWDVRLKWWPDGGQAPAKWQVLTDRPELLLPDVDYAIGLVAHRALVEFGPVRVERLPALRRLR